MKNIKVMDKGKVILEGKVADGNVKRIFDVFWDTPYTMVVGMERENEVQQRNGNQ